MRHEKLLRAIFLVGFSVCPLSLNAQNTTKTQRPPTQTPGQAAAPKPATKTPAAPPPGTNIGGQSSPPSGSSAGAGTPKPQPPAPAVQSVVTVTVKAVAEVSGKTFTLGEIADIQGEDAELKKQLTGMEVSTSPIPGFSRLLIPGDIIVKLRANRLESKRVELLAPPSIRIIRTGNEIASEEIAKAAKDTAKEAIKDIPGASLEVVSASGKITVPSGKVQILAGAWRGKPENGMLIVPVSLMVDGKPTQTVEVTLRIKRKMSVLVARRAIEFNELLSAENVVMSEVELPSGFVQPILALDEAIGKRAKRRLSADTPISASMLETPPAISAGGRITIEFVYGPIRITTTGLARQAGAVGDTIHVYATDTRKELDGVIIDNHTVRILDAGDNP